MAVYLLHFDQPYKHARHYLGYSAWGLRRRLDHHAAGTGARFMAVVTQAGIPWRLVRVWKKGDRTFERRLKNMAHPERICPACSGRRVYRKFKCA